TGKELIRQEIDLSAVTSQIARRLTDSQPGRKAAWNIHSGLLVEADLPLIEIAMTNLLENAWKYTQPAEEALIEVGSQVMDGRLVYFVRDNGVGFDMAHAGKLFGAFQRLHSQSEFPGTGIGLATVQRIIHRHGGSIWAESSPGSGAVFYFYL
ncbi:MAG: ATP-binding protein, partial [Chloroflexota bacterium]